ncbi:MAG: DUF4920 domain-containing protein [Bacteroidetes bacterium]|nr:DUF4920 domain-containing protein [Bacteroidota bacterium]
MKNLIALFLTVIVFTNCNHDKHITASETSYGASFVKASPLNGNQLLEQMQGKERLQCQFKGTINMTCKKAGCWMEVAMPNGEAMTVFMKDHAFAVPLENCEGKSTVVSGEAFYKELSVAYLKHLAEDAGKTAAEIASITEPKKVLAFTATGVIISEGGAGGKGTKKGKDCAHE